MTNIRESLREFRWRVRGYMNGVKRKISDFFESKNMRFLVHWPSWLKAMLYLFPALILLAVFTFYPIINSFMISFFEGYNIQTGEFDDYTIIGNYVHVLKLAGFRQAVINTGIIVFISVPVSIIVSLVLAVALASIKSLKGFYQTIFFLPYITNQIAIGLVFAYMFKGNSNDLFNLGLANQIITWFGGQPIVWVGVGATFWSAMSVILIYSVWNGLAFKIIVFLAGIQSVDKQYYQAAKIDGSSRYKSFRRITVPLISPMIFYILITSVIGGFKVYTTVVAIINQDGLLPYGRDGMINLKTIVFYVYDYIGLAAEDGMMSYASAAAILLFALILVFTLFQLYVGKKRVHY